MADLKRKIEDWMVRVSFAEAGAADVGFEVTGVELNRKTRLALDRVRMVRSERGSRKEMEGDMGEAGQQGEGGANDIPLSVMILDDEPIVGKRLQPVLEKSGFVVECFEDPAEAMARLDEKEFDVIVTDLRMEGKDGIEILEHVMEHCEQTRVILITGYATVEVAREALIKGAFDFISKPFKPQDLRAVVNKAALSLGHRAVL